MALPVKGVKMGALVERSGVGPAVEGRPGVVELASRSEV